MNKRKIDVLVLSDVHLGASGCKAKELHHYLKSVDPQMVILNGDIIDVWNFKKWYFPEYHMKVVRQLIKLASRVPVYYITGNHDEALRKYSEMRMGHLQLCDRLSLNIDGQQSKSPWAKSLQSYSNSISRCNRATGTAGIKRSTCTEVLLSRSGSTCFMTSGFGASCYR